MRNKYIPLIVALVFGSIAALGFIKMNKADTPDETVEIYVAARVINTSEKIKEDAVKLERWPASNAPKDAVRKWQDLEGKYVTQRIFEGEPVLVRKLLDSKHAKGWIPAGFTTIDIDPADASTIANLVVPGDRVNVMAFFPKRDLVTEATTKTVLSGIRVYAVDGKTSREELEEAKASKNSQKTVSLVMHPQDAEAWTWAKELGKISLSLGKADQSGVDETGPNPAGQEFLAWLASLRAPKVVIADPEPVVIQPEEPEKPEVTHRMVKVGPDGQMVVYTWEKGNPVPQITTMDSPNTPSAENTTAGPSGGNLDYLNGESSPLFSDPERDISVDNPNYNPFQNSQQR